MVGMNCAIIASDYRMTIVKPVLSVAPRIVAERIFSMYFSRPSGFVNVTSDVASPKYDVASTRFCQAPTSSGTSSASVSPVKSALAPALKATLFLFAAVPSLSTTAPLNHGRTNAPVAVEHITLVAKLFVSTVTSPVPEFFNIQELEAVTLLIVVEEDASVTSVTASP